MVYTNNFNKGNFSQTPTTKQGKSTSKYGRVIDIILDESHPDYYKKGGAIAINGVYFRYESTDSSEDTSTDLRFAFQGTGNIKVVPTVGEIVEIQSRPTSRNSDLTGKTATYYTSIVNIWNHPNSNTYLDVFSNSELDISKKGEFIQSPTISPLKSAVGDIQFEGRQGQSIRFTGAKGLANSFIDDTNIGKPVIILSNGKPETPQGFLTISEDINKDNSSIYIVSDHLIPLTQASEKRDSYKEAPVKADKFKGNQILINTGRFFVNAKEDDILLSSLKSIGLNSESTINIDATDYFCVDGSQIYLGKKPLKSPAANIEPVLLGNQTEVFLEKLLDMLEGMAKDMSQAKTIKGDSIPRINKRGAQMIPVIKVLRNRINTNGPSKLKSKKVFTE